MTRRLLVLLAALVALLGAWIFATPPFQAPDENAHYLRALELGSGHLVGPREPYLAPTQTQTDWVQHDARGVRVAPRLSPPGGRCLDGRPDTSSRGCIEVSYTGDYAPLPYLVPAVAIRTAHTAGRALWSARIASTLVVFAFLALAAGLLWSGTLLSVLGLLLALTPTTFFVGSVLNPNGLEIAAGLAFAAAVLRVARAPHACPGWVWGAAAVSGAVAVLAWQLGFAYVGLDGLLGVGLAGRRGLAGRETGRRRGALTVAAVLALALVAYAVYSVATGSSHGHLAVGGAGLGAGLHQLAATIHGAVGLFGMLDVPLPHASVWVWWVLVVGVGLAAALRTGWRERILLALVVLVAFAFPVLFFGWVYRFSGFGLQPRYVLPVLQLVPLLAGELLHRSREGLPPAVAHRLVPAAVTVVAGFEMYAWWINASASAGRPSSLRFPAHAAWAPPLSWAPWIGLVLAGGLLLAGLAAGEALGWRSADRTPPRARPTAD